MKIYLIGASGAIGFSLFNYLRKKFSIVGTYNKNFKKNLIKFSLQNKKHEKKILQKVTSADVFIILSAKTDVRWVYQNQKKSYQVNSKLIKKFINSLIKKKARIIYLSSAEVFNGRRGFYKETSKPNPVNVYGKTKYLVEKHLVRSGYNRYHIIRTGRIINMSDEYRCMIEDTYLTLLKEDSRMASDNLFTITDVNDFIRSIEKLIKKKTNQKIFHLCSNEVLSRTRFADYVIKFSKLKRFMKYKIVKFKDIGYNEPRACKNNIDSKLSKKILDLSFRKAKFIIKEKVRILDYIYEKRYSK